MKSFTKRILAAGLALAVVTGVSGATVFADSSAPQTTAPQRFAEPVYRANLT